MLLLQHVESLLEGTGPGVGIPHRILLGFEAECIIFSRRALLTPFAPPWEGEPFGEAEKDSLGFVVSGVHEVSTLF